MTITVIHVIHQRTGKSTVTQNLAVPLANKPVRPPATEVFETPNDALARAKQLQTEAGGPDMVRIDERDLRKKPAP